MNNRFIQTVSFLVALSIFAAAFFTPAEAAAPGTPPEDVFFWANSAYQVYMNFTGPHGARHIVALGDGPYSKGESFIWQGGAYKFTRYVRSDGSVSADDRVGVTFNSITNSRLIRTATLSRFCDPDSSGNSSAGDCHIGTMPTCSCDVGNVSLRLIALDDAMDDTNPWVYRNELIIEFEAANLFWGQSDGNIIWFEDSTNSIFFATDEYDRSLTMDPSMIGHARVFKSPNVEMFVVRETDFYSDVDSTAFNASMDLNNEVFSANSSPDDDDLLVVVASGGRKREYGVIDFSDRNYNTANTWMHSNGVGVYSAFSDSDTAANYASRVAEADVASQNWTRLQSPLNPNTYFLYWGTDQRLEHVGICFGCKAAR